MRSHVSNSWLPFLAMLGAILSLCLGSSWAKGIFPIVGSSGATALRLTFSALILLIVMRPWRFPAMSNRDRWRVLLYGAVLGLMNWMFYQSIRTIPFGLAVAIELMGPLLVALISSGRFLDVVWVGVASAGLSLILPIFGQLDASALDPAGIAWAFGAAACWGTYILIGKSAQHLPLPQVLPLGLLVACLIFAPIGIIETGAVLWTPRILLIGLLVGLVSSAIPYSLEFFAIKRLPTQTFGTLAAMEPAVAAMVGWLMLGELLTGIQWIAIGLVMAASVGAVMTSQRQTAVIAQ